MIPSHLASLAKQLTVTDPEIQENYILTPLEEAKILENEVQRLKNFVSWKCEMMGMKQEEILFKLSQMNLEADIDKQKLFTKANSTKHHKIWEEERRNAQRESEAEEEKKLQEKWNARFLFSFMKNVSITEYNKKLIVNEKTSPLITTICFFISRDPRFETELNYSFAKGLYLRGPNGIGKTFLVKCIQDNELHPVTIASTIEINEGVHDEGGYFPEIKKRGIFYMDDVGTEEGSVKHFGTNISWIKNFIEKFYLRGNNFNSLMISTNNSFDEIQSKYGKRVRSRIREMFNIVDVEGDDMRI